MGDVGAVVHGGTDHWPRTGWPSRRGPARFRPALPLVGGGIVGLAWSAAALALLLTMAVAPSLGGPTATRRSELSTPGAAAAELRVRTEAALAAELAGDVEAGSAEWEDLLATANVVDAAMADLGPNGRPLAERVRTAAGPVRAAVAYVRAAASVRESDPAQAAHRLQRALRLLGPAGRAGANGPAGAAD